MIDTWWLKSNDKWNNLTDKNFFVNYLKEITWWFIGISQYNTCPIEKIVEYISKWVPASEFKYSDINVMQSIIQMEYLHWEHYETIFNANQYEKKRWVYPWEVRYEDIILEIEKTNSIIKNIDRKEGYVYLIKCSEYYKIWMTKNIETRVKAIISQNPHESELVHYYKCDYYSKEERRLHNMFKSKHYKWEWFFLDKEDVDYIKSL